MEVKPPNGLTPNNLHHQQQQIRAPNATLSPSPNPNPNSAASADAPPKQVATAMERLSEAARLISDIRMGADRLLEAMFVAANPHQANKPLDLFIKEDSSMRQHLLDLRSIGRQLEESGVLSESLRTRSNSWGLHLPVVCPDGAIVAYAWKRQLAGQAGASAVDRTRLALKAFGDQKRRFFPHLEDDRVDSPASKRHCSPQETPQATSQEEEFDECKTLEEVLERMEKEVSSVKIFPHDRLGWLRRASELPGADNDSAFEMAKDHAFSSFGKLGARTRNIVDVNKVSVIEVLVPSVLRCIVSLHPAGSVDADAVAFFSPDEGGGSHVHARGVSVYHVFRLITEHAAVALQHFLGVRGETALYTLLHWICSYQTVLSKVCSKCGRVLAIDQKSSLLLPPIHHPYRQFAPTKPSPAPPTTKDQSPDAPGAYHIGCFPNDL